MRTMREFWRSWTLGLWLVVALPLLQSALAGNVRWLNEIVESQSRQAWWRLSAATFLFQWAPVRRRLPVLRREGPGLAELSLAGSAAGSTSGRCCWPLGGCSVRRTRSGVVASTAASPVPSASSAPPRSC